MKNYYLNSWIEQDKGHKTSLFKRLFYCFTRPLLSAYARRYLSSENISNLNPSLILPGRGMPLETRRHWGAAFCNIKEATVLVQGTGTGWDVISWARLKPKKIIATDLFEFKQSWEQIASYCHSSLGVNVEFRQSSLEDHSFLTDNSIDLCASDAVFEHCLDLKSVLQESFRILKPGGTLYASYGPLWYCAGGDHFSGRGGLENAFNHLALDSQDYVKYVQKFSGKDEDFQSGGRYIELNLFSRLKTKDYCSLFKETNFTMKNLMLEVSPQSLAFKNKFPNLFNQLKDNYLNKCDVDDFLISANIVRLLKSFTY